jgi:hypothetical protein
MLTFVTICKMLIEVALLALAGQFVLGLLAGAKRDSNLFYQLLKVVASPAVRLVRSISPKAVLDSHVPLAAFILLLVIWVALTLMKIDLCMQAGVQTCR